LELRVCRELVVEVVRDCREMVVEVARKGEGINNTFEMVYMGNSLGVVQLGLKLRVCRELVVEVVRDCREMVVEVARKGKGINSTFEMVYMGNSLGVVQFLVSYNFECMAVFPLKLYFPLFTFSALVMFLGNNTTLGFANFGP
nr:hypothetical protein [Tanacetum cinerariifolium]